MASGDREIFHQQIVRAVAEPASSASRYWTKNKGKSYSGNSFAFEDMSTSPCSSIQPSPALSIFRGPLSNESLGLSQCRDLQLQHLNGWSPQKSPPALIATPADFTLRSSNLRYYVDASTQYSPATSMNTASPGASIAVLEREAPTTKLHSSQEATQSPKISSPGLDAPHSPSTVPQFPTTKQRLSRERLQSDSPLASTNSSSPESVKPVPIRVKILPVGYEVCKVEDLVVLISCMISELIRLNDQRPLRDSDLTRFHSKWVQLSAVLIMELS